MNRRNALTFATGSLLYVGANPIIAAPAFEPRGGPDGFLARLTDLIRQGVIKKGKSKIDEIKSMFGTLPLRGKSLADVEIVEVTAYMGDMWGIPPQAIIEGVDQPEPNPWQTRWIIEFTFNKTGVLADVRIRLMEGKWD